jgi:hypothetical protein
MKPIQQVKLLINKIQTKAVKIKTIKVLQTTSQNLKVAIKSI